MQITRQADYAIRAMLYLARHANQRPPTSLVAEETKVPPSFLAKIIAQLSVAGLVYTLRGARGGITLARDPAEITLLDVVEAVDGPILLNDCVSDAFYCNFKEECPLYPIWVETQSHLINRLRSVTFAQLSEQAA